jgi:ABC-2 type transport system permease protein
VKSIQQWRDLAIAAARIGFGDISSIYTIWTWIFGWFGRLVIQVIFFTLFGLLLGSARLVDYRLIGNSAALVSIEAMVVVLVVLRERGEGTLGLQVMAPMPFAITYIARGTCNLLIGIGSSSAAFVIGVLIFRVPLAIPQALLTPAIVAVMGLASYCFGLTIGSVVLAQPGLGWLGINVGYLSIMTFSGVNVPVHYWPYAIRTLAQVLPLSHGLAGLRLLLSGGSYLVAARDVAWEALVGAGWLTIAVCLLTAGVHHGRRAGTLEFADS